MPRMMLRAAVLMIVCPLWSLSAVQAQTPANGETAGERGLKAWWHRHVTHVRHEAEVPEDTAGVVVIRAQSPLTHLDDEDDELDATYFAPISGAQPASSRQPAYPAVATTAQPVPAQDVTHKRHINPPLIPGAGFATLGAPLYPCPQPNIPLNVGATVITNEALYPHEFLYPHCYRGLYAPFYHKTHRSWVMTPFGIYKNERRVLTGTEVCVKYKSFISPLSLFLPPN